MLSAQSLPDPLSPSELRLILTQLYELQAARAKILAYEDFIAREREQDAKEKALADRALEVEKQATANALDRAALAEEKAALYKALWEAGKPKKCGIGGRLWWFFSIGTHRCGG